MDRKTKVIFITATLVMWALAGTVVVGGMYLAEKLEDIMPVFKEFAEPEALMAPGVLVGEGAFSKTTLRKENFLGNITDIKIKAGGSLNKGEIILVGSRGAVFLDADDPSVANSSVYFEDHADFVELIDLEGDGVEEFMGRGCWCKPPIVIDSEGDTVWQYEREDEKVVDMVSADIDGDGYLEFVAGLLDGGIRMVDTNDKRLRKRSSPPVKHIEVADVDGNGTLDIIFSTLSGELTVIDSSGKNINVRELPDTAPDTTKEETTEIWDFTLVRWPDDGGKQYILSPGNGVVRFHDLRGEFVSELEVEYSFDFAYARGAGFNGAGGENYFAVLLAHDYWGVSVLSIYDETSSVVYEEVLEGSYFSLAVGHGMGGGGSDNLLIGGKGDLIGYAFNEDGRTE